MDTLILSSNELKIMEIIRSMKPYEGLFIQADASGKPDSFVISRSTKMILTFGQEPRPTPGRPNLASQ